MASLGQELKRERELRGISLQEIASTTRINPKFLEALEEDRLDDLPGKFFIKAMLRSYAKSIGLEEDYVLNKYGEIKLYEMRTPQGEHRRRSWSWPKISRRNVFFLTSAVILLAALIIILVRLFSHESPVSTEPLKSSTAALVRQEPQPEPPATGSPQEKTGLHMAISFIDKTWIQVYADGELKLDGIKLAGETSDIRALKQLAINLGNAGGLTYNLNGKKGIPFGPPGAVRKNIVITLENRKQFLQEEETNRVS